MQPSSKLRLHPCLHALSYPKSHVFNETWVNGMTEKSTNSAEHLVVELPCLCTALQLARMPTSFHLNFSVQTCSTHWPVTSEHICQEQ